MYSSRCKILCQQLLGLSPCGSQLHPISWQLHMQCHNCHHQATLSKSDHLVPFTYKSLSFLQRCAQWKKAASVRSTLYPGEPSASAPPTAQNGSLANGQSQGLGTVWLRTMGCCTHLSTLEPEGALGPESHLGAVVTVSLLSPSADAASPPLDNRGM
jgi:hypothetical protein